MQRLPAESKKMSSPSSGNLDSQLYILSLSKLFKDMGTGMLAFMIPLYIVDLHSTLFASTPIVVKAGLVATAFGISNTISQPIMGNLSDRMDRRKSFILAGMVGFTILSFIYANTRQFEYVVLFRFVQGITVGVAVPAIVAMVTHFSTSRTRGKAIGIYSSLRGLGFGSGPIVGGAVVNYYGYEAAFYVCALLGILSTSLVFFFVRETHGDIQDKTSGGVSYAKDPQFIVLAVAMFMMMVGIMIIFAFLPEYRTRFNASELSLSMAVSAYVLVRVLFQTPMGMISDRVGRKKMVAYGLLLNVPIVIGLGYAGSITELIILRALQGISMAAVETPVMALAVELTGGNAVSSRVSIITAAQAGGMALGPIMGGLLAGYVSFRTPFYLCGALILLSFFMILAKVKEPGKTNG
ncbi:MAG: MFS transporter [Methanolobus sp.]|uniref:MFS transporter n=1 Tax=Methanolobus sp. TaxID=1874737 RepID=UPI002730B4BE|nr:MFS transporter [Methanolobus sp.]MDP2216461.1 MFS transporter [Methanolobus sp.]